MSEVRMGLGLFLSAVAQVQSLYRAALHRIAAKASEYEAMDNGQGRVMRMMVEEALRDADKQTKELLDHVARARRRR